MFTISQQKTNFAKIETIKEILELNAKRYPLRNAFLLKDKDGGLLPITYKTFFSNVQSLSASLIKTHGLSGKKVAVCLKNCYEWCVSYFAVCSGVGVTAALEYGMITDDLLSIIDFAEIDAIITDSKVASKLLEKKDALRESFKIITVDGCAEDETTDFYSLIEGGKELLKNGEIDISSLTVDPDALAVLLFTSGTTGMAKGVMLSNRNIVSDMIGVSNVCIIDYNDSTLCTLPLHHTYQAIVMLMVIYIGGTVSFSDSLRHIPSDLKTFKPTVFASVPLLLEKTHEKILKNLSEQTGLKKSFASKKATALLSKIPSDELKKHIYSQIHSQFGGRLRMIISGAAAMDEDVAKDYMAFGFNFLIGYGLTECSPIAICNNSEDPRPNSIGKAIDGAEVKILDPNEDGIGEICVKGPMVMLGYYKLKEETDKVIKDGFLHTGDLGYCDEEGFYHITGRIKNVIVTKNGKNVYPEELEYYLNKEPLVLESLIFGDEDENRNEQVAAQVVPNEEAIKQTLQKEKLTKEEIHSAIMQVVRKINQKLPSYKNIRKVHIRENEFEKTSTNKIKRGSQKNRKNKNG